MIVSEYCEKITSHLNTLAKEEISSIEKAAGLVADQLRKDKLVHVTGPGGHSNIGAMEVFFRAGGLMNINPILDTGTMLQDGALRSMAVERLPGYGKIVFNDYKIEKGDLIIIVNAYGINSAVIDIALCAQEKGVGIIAVTSVQHARKTPKDHPARHPSKKNLCDLANVVLDSKIEPGDAVLSIDGIAQNTGPMSTYATCFLLNSTVARSLEILASEGIDPPMWKSGNAPGGDEWNQRFIDRFKGRVRIL